MSEVKKILTQIDVALEDDPSYGEGVNAVYQFEINDEEPGIYQLILKDDEKYTTDKEEKDPDCTLIMASDDFVKLSNGDLNGTQAFMGGKLKIKGNMGLALKLQSILTSFNKN